MTITLYNSLKQQTEAFVPIDPERISMYVCGPTVYDTPHLGNARPAVVFDLLYRLLRQCYGVDAVVYARNYTDIDDKIMARAAERGEPIEALTRRTIAEYEAVTQALGCLEPNHKPRATGAIPGIVAMIRTLIERGHAYEAEGHVLFDVASYPEHGALSRHDQEDLRAGARVEPASYKRSPSDFVLWKPSLASQPGFASPFGRGRPGWHIECSAMIGGLFGATIDIHAGGTDLRFPHHDCEISQSACMHGAPLARYWLHNGLILTQGRRMGKSEGNGITPRLLLDNGVAGDAIRLAILSIHYRAPLDWTDDTLPRAEQTLARWRNALLPYSGRISPEGAAIPREVLAALCNDLNVAEAVAVIHKAISRINQGASDEFVAETLAALRLIGLLPDITEAVVGDAAEIDALVAERNRARKIKDFARADQIRTELQSRGVELRDTEGQTHWWRR